MSGPYKPTRSGEAHYNSYVAVPSADIPQSIATDAPNGDHFAQIVYQVGGGGGGEGGVTEVSGTVAITSAEDFSGSYQDVVINDQLTLSTTQQSVTPNTNKGYIKVRISAGGSVHLGTTGVTTSNGYLLDDDYPVETLTFEDMSELFAIGSGTLYVIGGVVTT